MLILNHLNKELNIVGLQGQIFCHIVVRLLSILSISVICLSVNLIVPPYKVAH